jgi:5,6,7,8-tetrahydromethanopterin hydro-lyase
VTWYFKQYRIGKRRQWVGAPIPVAIQYSKGVNYLIDRPEAGGKEPVPSLHVLSEQTERSKIFGFKRPAPGLWITLLDTTLLGPGQYELLFEVDQGAMLHASDQPLLLLAPNDYRAVLLDEAGEEFMPSRTLFNCHQLEQLMHSKIAQELPDWEVRITRRVQSLPKPIATAPIYWVLDALVSEFNYLATGNPMFVSEDFGWYLDLQDDMLIIGFFIALGNLFGEEVASYIAKRELDDLYLLNALGHPPMFESFIDISGQIANVKVKADIYKAPVVQPERPVLVGGHSALPGTTSRKISKMLVGESLVGDGNEVAHIDLIIGPRGSAAERAFANALTNNKDGFTALLAVVAPNLATKPSTVMFNKVTIKGANQALQMFGPAQHAVAKAVADSVADGTIPAVEADDVFICVGVFIHWEAADDKKIHDFNYRAVKESIERAVNGWPTPAEVVQQRNAVKHPFAPDAGFLA